MEPSSLTYDDEVTLAADEEGPVGFESAALYREETVPVPYRWELDGEGRSTADCPRGRCRPMTNPAYCPRNRSVLSLTTKCPD